MDEPTRGLDPQSARDLRQTVKRLADGGATIFLTTHDMHEADELCARVAFLADGKIVALDTPRALKLSLGTQAPEVDVVLDDGTRAAPARCTTPATRARLQELVGARRVRSLHSLEPTLADVFIHLAGRSLDDDDDDEARGMSLRRIFAILLKDLRDAGRDGRILVLLALPIGMAVFYNATIGDDDELPETKVAVVESGGGALARELRTATRQERRS